MTQVRMKREDRHKHLLQVACRIAHKEGLQACTRAAVAAGAGVTAPNLNRYWPNPDAMRKEVLQTAVAANDAKWLRKQVAAGVSLVGIKMPKALREEIAKG